MSVASDIEKVKALLYQVRLHDGGESEPGGASDSCCMAFHDWDDAWAALGRINAFVESAEITRTPAPSQDMELREIEPDPVLSPEIEGASE